MYKIMTPGPTQVAENVRLARSRECTNPDLDENFVEFYKETCEEISRLLHTDNETLILGGEGILGLEAACASMTEPGDRPRSGQRHLRQRIRRFCFHVRGMSGALLQRLP